MALFTRTWFLRNRAHWQTHLAPLAGQRLLYLEVGIFEGRSACWMMDNVLTHPESRYIGIDPWILSPSRYPDPSIIESRARANLASFASKATIIKGRSQEVLAEGLVPVATLDIAYIDGDHTREGVLADSELVWPLMKDGGILIWDDYWMRRSHAVRDAVDGFLDTIAGRYELLFKNRQVAIRKASC